MPVTQYPGRRPFPHPRTKSAATSANSSVAVTAEATPDSSRAQSPAVSTLSSIPALHTDEHYPTASFVHRVLCSGSDDHRVEDHIDASGSQPLPSLTSSNDLDLQLYAFVAIIINDNVSTWYSKITADRCFVDEIVHLVAHCTRGFEERLRRVDLVNLLFNDVADLLISHLSAWRTACQAARASDDKSPIYSIYHALRPHQALSPVPDPSHAASALEEQQRNDSAYRNLLSQALLAILLPVEDLQNPCLFALVSEVLADLVLGKFLSIRIPQETFVYECVRKGADYAGHRLQNTPWLADPNLETKDRLKTYGLLSNTAIASKTSSFSWRTITSTFWLVAQVIYLIALGIRAGIQGLLSSASLPHRTAHYPSSPHMNKPGISTGGSGPVQSSPSLPGSPANTTSSSNQSESLLPALQLKLWRAVCNLLWLESRMPWLCGLGMSVQSIALHGPGQVGSANSRIDRPSLLIDPFLKIIGQYVRQAIEVFQRSYGAAVRKHLIHSSVDKFKT